MRTLPNSPAARIGGQPYGELDAGGNVLMLTVRGTRYFYTIAFCLN